MKLDILIVNYNTEHLLQSMFDACALASDDVGTHYWVVDNASTDNSAETLKQRFPQVELVVNTNNVGFGRANNQLLPFLDDSSEFVLLLNTDAFVGKDTFHSTLAYMQAHPEVGVLGVRLVGRDGELQPSCRYFPTPFNVFLARSGLGQLVPWIRLVDDMGWSHDEVRECDWVPGCYYLVRKTVLDQVGLFDPRYFLYSEEVDHCKRVKAAGWEVVFYPHTTVVHIGGESAKSAGTLTDGGRQLSILQVESELLYFRKHHGLFGLWLHLLLSHLGDMILATKDVLRHRGWQAAKKHFAHSTMVRKLCAATQWGHSPTR